MNTSENTISNRQAATTGLAVIGFITLVIAGIWLAVYSTRFVPDVVGGIGSAAVYLGSIFTPSNTPGLVVVPIATTTPTDVIDFGGGNTSTTTATSTDPVYTPPKPTPGTPTNVIYPIGGGGSPVLSGLPDLVVTIKAIGYLSTASTDSFTTSATVPNGSRPAVTFTIKNIGTNTTGSWRFSASIPTQSGYIYQSQPQQSLNPGDSIEYTLGFDQANPGSNKTISVTANFDHAIAESNTANNNASASLTILGS